MVETNKCVKVEFNSEKKVTTHYKCDKWETCKQIYYKDNYGESHCDKGEYMVMDEIKSLDIIPHVKEGKKDETVR